MLNDNILRSEGGGWMMGLLSPDVVGTLVVLVSLVDMVRRCTIDPAVRRLKSLQNLKFTTTKELGLDGWKIRRGGRREFTLLCSSVDCTCSMHPRSKRFVVILCIA
jgi:hypothetical protein